MAVNMVIKSALNAEAQRAKSALNAEAQRPKKL